MQREVEAAPVAVALREARVDVGEVLRVRRVAGEEDLEVGGEDRVAAPERLHAVGQRPARPMLDGSEDDLERADARALPPVELDRIRDSRVGEPCLEAERNDEERRPSRLRGERLHARRVEMVVVVVRDDDGVDVRQVGERDPGRERALRAGEGERRRALGEDRIGQDVAAADLDQRARVADPCHRGNHRRAGCGVGVHEREVRLRRAASRAAAPRAARRVPPRSATSAAHRDPSARTRCSCSGSACRGDALARWRPGRRR